VLRRQLSLVPVDRQMIRVSFSRSEGRDGTWTHRVSEGVRRDCQLGDVEPDNASGRPVDGDLPGEGLLGDVAGPPDPELLALFLRGIDELGEALVAGVLGCGRVKLAEEVAATLFSADAHGCGGSLGEVEPDEVAPPGGKRA